MLAKFLTIVSSSAACSGLSVPINTGGSGVLMTVTGTSTGAAAGPPPTLVAMMDNVALPNWNDGKRNLNVVAPVAGSTIVVALTKPGLLLETVKVDESPSGSKNHEFKLKSMTCSVCLLSSNCKERRLVSPLMPMKIGGELSPSTLINTVPVAIAGGTPLSTTRYSNWSGPLKFAGGV